jgi:hypothetical protein
VEVRRIVFHSALKRINPHNFNRTAVIKNKSLTFEGLGIKEETVPARDFLNDSHVIRLIFF